MGGPELQRRIRNKKRRASRKARADARTSNELGGTMVKGLRELIHERLRRNEMKTWDENSGYTDEAWRAECERRSAEIKKEKYVISRDKAKSKQVGGDHYKNMGVEPWDVVDTWPMEQRIGAYRAGALKYLMRMGSKDEQLQEIKKCGHYIEKLIEVLEEA